MNHRCGENTLAEHELMPHVPRTFVFPEIRHQRTHVTLGIARHLPGCGVYVRQQTVTQADGRYHGIVNGFAGLPVEIYFTGHFRTVAAEHRTEHPVLHPTRIKFTVQRIMYGRPVIPSLIICSGEKTADVRIIIRIARQREIQTGRNLCPENLP